MFRILLVEDDPNTRKLFAAVLTQGGYEPVLACDGVEALEVLDRTQVDLCVVDLMMPRMDGYTFTETLREGGWQIPVLIVTAKEMPADKRRGFAIGCDDYMIKPVDEEEMLWRIAALLRRSKIAAERKLVIGSTTLRYDALSVRVGDVQINLPQKEFLLLFKLLSYPDQIFTRRQLMDELWDMETDTDERTVDVHINRLRDRFKGNPDFSIVTVRGLGYKGVSLHG